MKTVKSTIDQFELSYSIQGDGTPTLVIGSSIYYPRTFSKNLSNYLQMIFVDHRGFSRMLESVDHSAYELDVLLNDIEFMRKQLHLDKLIIMGHSGHAYLALEYAKKYPQHVSHVVLIAQSPNSFDAAFNAADRYFDESVCPERKAIYAENMRKLAGDIAKDPDRKFIHYSLRSGARIWYDYHFDATSLWKDVYVNPEIFDYVWGKIFRELDITKELNNFNLPVLLMLGRYDYWNPPHLWETYRQHFKDLTIRIFEKSGHTPQLEEAELFNQELLSWLKSHAK